MIEFMILQLINNDRVNDIIMILINNDMVYNIITDK